MYYPTKTSAFISLISAGAIALAGVTVASAHTSRFEDLSPASGISGQLISNEALNKTDKAPALTEQVPGKTEHREAWLTATNDAVPSHLASNRRTLPTTDAEEGTMHSDDYDVSKDQPDSRHGSTDSSASGDSTSRQETKDARGLSKDDPAHTGPQSHIHAGRHQNQ